MTDLAKPQLHQSSIATLSRCPMQYYYRYVEGIIIPPAVAMAVGSATHKGVEVNMRHKLEKKSLAPREMVREAASAEIKAIFGKGVNLEGDEEFAGKDAREVRGMAEDQAVTLSQLHYDELAPGIFPLFVERKWVLQLTGYPMDLAGQIDLQEVLAIRDTKTAGKTPPQSDADNSSQLSMYALAAKVTDGKIPERFALDALVKLKKPKAVTLWTTRDEQDITVLLRRLERAIELITSGKFMPCDPTHWVCSKRFCGYFSRCPFSKKPVSVAV